MISKKDFAIFILQIEKERLTLQEKLLLTKSDEEKSQLEKRMVALVKIMNSIYNYVEISKDF